MVRAKLMVWLGVSSVTLLLILGSGTSASGEVGPREPQPLLPESPFGGHFTLSVALPGTKRRLAENVGAGNFPCQKPGYEFVCYGPLQLRAAYGFTPLITHGEDGRGKTIVIIVSNQDPTLSKDLAEFDSRFKLPAPPSFEVVAPFGITPFKPSNPADVVASLEIAIDVEWSHAIAPGAKIVLALGRSISNSDIVATERYVIEHNLGDVVSMSFTETEECMPNALLEEEHALFKKAVSQGMTLVAGAGDQGAAEFNCEETALLSHPAVGVPASDPDVTAVGGTSLQANLSSGEYESESVWNDEGGAGGGGFSVLYPTPRYQKGVPAIGTRRGVPDVAYNAGFNDSTIIAWGSSGERGSDWFFSSGTSLGAPQWAGLTAIAAQVAGHRLGNINPALYSIAKGKDYSRAFHDVTTGNNSFGSVTGFSAAPGWDAASGWGSPIAEFLVPRLAQTAGNGANAEP
jgi:subtilase family serine protease